MDFSWLKRSMPRGIYGRAALILLLPIVVLQVVVSVVFIQRHFEDVTQQMTDSLLLELRHLTGEVAAAPDAETALAEVAGLAEALRLQLALPGEEMHGFKRPFYDVSGATVIAELRGGLEGVEAVDLSENSRRVSLQVSTPHGPLSIGFDRRRVSASNPHQFLVLMGFVGVVMALVAFIYLRNQLRPITRLAAAAEAFGRGRIEPYKPAGAVEVRSAGNAFLDMRNRIERQTAQRTMLLSGVSHDLRTPLTRMKLGLSLAEADGADVEELARDVAEMEAMLDGFLAFVRSEAGEAAEAVNVVELAERVAEKARRAGGMVELERRGEGSREIAIRALSVERAVANLLSNARRYGSKARLSLDLGERMVRFTVEDDGPGIPEARREEAMRAFTRLDEARNQDAGGGVGLGLAIALDVARSHGGTLRLGESEALGGLKAELVLAR
ncbi:ATP-binding protein [Vannielia litorea]|uniref:histidine kinase n=1 Tax=Vannielia litorea TaxID=1217970 RepID=A0A1N6FLU3_9RHOB|nr:ATP-binding protein [Vannielia litorea]SIN96206.1 two-component system, OmpR family, osmolarity sensor histidine kinase EnvZ [Vannielia litorea]